MKILILGFDVDDQYSQMFEEQAGYFNCTFYNFINQDDLIDSLNNITIPTILLFNVDVREQVKYELCAALSKRDNIHVVFAASEIEPERRVRWLNYGANSYIKKPYYIEEVLRRANIIVESGGATHISDSNFSVDLKARNIVYQGALLKTTPKLFDIIVYFMENEGRIVSRSEIMDNVFNTRHYLTDRNIDTLIKQLRKLTSADIVSTIRGSGYRYISNQKANKLKH